MTDATYSIKRITDEEARTLPLTKHMEVCNTSSDDGIAKGYVFYDSPKRRCIGLTTEQYKILSERMREEHSKYMEKKRRITRAK
jgi:hypothetical protein